MLSTEGVEINRRPQLSIDLNGNENPILKYNGTSDRDHTGHLKELSRTALVT